MKSTVATASFDGGFSITASLYGIKPGQSFTVVISGPEGSYTFAGAAPEIDERSDTATFSLERGKKNEATSEITYANAKANIPECWRILRVIDLDTGQEVKHVVEADTKAGWLVRYIQEGRRTVGATERVHGRFKMEIDTSVKPR